MDLGWSGGIRTIDLLLVLYFLLFFVIGYAQGTIRRLLGIGAILFSFLFAANIAEPLGGFLGDNWRQFVPQYSYMVGFLTVFVAAAIAFAIVVQGFYTTQPLFENARFVDEVIGGLLGILQAGIILGAIVIILDTYFLVPGQPDSPGELIVLRELWTELDASRIVEIFRATLIPAFFLLFGLFVPSTIKALYPGSPA